MQSVSFESMTGNIIRGKLYHVNDGATPRTAIIQYEGYHWLMFWRKCIYYKHLKLSQVIIGW